MKILKNISIVALMLTTLFSYASDEAEILALGKNKKVKVVFEDVHQGEVLVVKDLNGTILHKEVISEDGTLSRVFDFSNLENGNYEIDLDKESEIVRKPFSIESNSLVFKNDITTLYHKPLIQTTKNIIKVSKLNTLDKAAIVSLFYNNEEVFNENLSKESAHLTKLYTLKDYQNGAYKVVVKSEGKTYTKEFNL